MDPMDLTGLYISLERYPEMLPGGDLRVGKWVAEAAGF
jgi:hypothetical protein